MSDKKKQPDGIDLLCLELYGRKSVPADWMSGHNGKMLFDAASKIEALKDLVSMVRETLLVGKDPDCFSDHGSMEDAVTKAQELLKSEFSRRAMDDDREGQGLTIGPHAENEVLKRVIFDAILHGRFSDYPEDAADGMLRILSGPELAPGTRTSSDSSGIGVETEVIRDPESPGCGTVMFRITVDGCVVASASVHESHMSNARLMFGKGPADVYDELKSALRNRLRGVLKRFTVVDCMPDKGEGIWIGRILIMQRDHIEPHSVSYDFSTGETGPESMCEAARNAFRRHVHELVLNRRTS